MSDSYVYHLNVYYGIFYREVQCNLVHTVLQNTKFCGLGAHKAEMIIDGVPLISGVNSDNPHKAEFGFIAVSSMMIIGPECYSPEEQIANIDINAIKKCEEHNLIGRETINEIYANILLGFEKLNICATDVYCGWRAMSHIWRAASDDESPCDEQGMIIDRRDVGDEPPTTPAKKTNRKSNKVTAADSESSDMRPSEILPPLQTPLTASVNTDREAQIWQTEQSKQERRKSHVNHEAQDKRKSHENHKSHTKHEKLKRTTSGTDGQKIKLKKSSKNDGFIDLYGAPVIANTIAIPPPRLSLLSSQLPTASKKSTSRLKK